MTKKLSKTAQVALLKRLRRACPCSVWSGIYGYTCGGLTGGGTLFFRHGSTLKGGLPLLACLQHSSFASIQAGLRFNIVNL